MSKLILEVFNINESQERVQIIEKMLTYKKHLENSYEDFVDELINYYRNNNSPIALKRLMTQKED